MITTKSNGYTMSTDFADGVTRIRGSEIQERTCISDAGWKMLLNIPYDTEGARVLRVTYRDGAAWLTELHVYLLLHGLGDGHTNEEFKALTRSTLFEVIWAFVALRRLGPQAPEIINGAEVYARDTPAEEDMREKPDGRIHEMGVILLMLEGNARGDDAYLEPVSALHEITEIYSLLPSRGSDSHDVS